VRINRTSLATTPNPKKDKNYIFYHSRGPTTLSNICAFKIWETLVENGLPCSLVKLHHEALVIQHEHDCNPLPTVRQKTRAPRLQRDGPHHPGCPVQLCMIQLRNLFMTRQPYCSASWKKPTEDIFAQMHLTTKRNWELLSLEHDRRWHRPADTDRSECPSAPPCCDNAHPRRMPPKATYHYISLQDFSSPTELESTHAPKICKELTQSPSLSVASLHKASESEASLEGGGALGSRLGLTG